MKFIMKISILILVSVLIDHKQTCSRWSKCWLGLKCQISWREILNSIFSWHLTVLRLVQIFEMIIFWPRIINKLAYWTCLDVFQHQKPKFFPNFLPSSWTIWLLPLNWCIWEKTCQKGKLDSCINLDFSFKIGCYWTCLDLFQSILVKFEPEISISSSSIFLWHVKVAHF